MESSVCWNEISYRLKKSFLSPIRDLILNQDSYGQLFSLLVSQEFFPAIPCLTIYAATLLFVWRNHNMFEISSLAPSVNSNYFIPGQALLMWMFINISLTFWLLFQKVLYCFVWYSFTQKTKPWQNVASELWWFSGETEQLESTFSLGVYLCQPEYISWFLAEIIAVTIFYVVNMPSIKTQYKFEVQKKYNNCHVLKDLFEMGDCGKNEILQPPPELCQLRCRKGRPKKPYPPYPAEVSINFENNYENSDTDSH